MILDKAIADDLKKWTEKLGLSKQEIKLIKRNLKRMKMAEFKGIMNIITRKPNGELKDLWFNLDNFTPVTLTIYYLNIRSLMFLMVDVWEAKYSDRTRTTEIIAAIPEQKYKHASRYNFTHSEKQGKKCPNTKYWEDKRGQGLW